MRSNSFVRKAVIPAAGLGTRMLSVSNVIPKELLPLGGKPLIQHAIEEAIESGVEEVIVVTRPEKSLLNAFLAGDWELAGSALGQKADTDALSRKVNFILVDQPQPRGLGDALLCAQSAIGNEPFGVILPDAIVEADIPALAQLAAAFREQESAYVATQPVGLADTSRFGMLAVDPCDPIGARDTFRVRSIVEKPHPRQAPSRFGVFGRYILTRQIFSFLSEIAIDTVGDVELSNALSGYCERHSLLAVRFDGRHYDAGDPLGYHQAVLEFTLKNSDIGSSLRDYLLRNIERESDERAITALPDLL